MTASPWTLDTSNARLKLGSLAALVNLSDPASGVQEICLDSTMIQASLLGVLLQPHVETLPTDAYTRGEDLVATYPPAMGRAMRIQVYWRCHAEPHRLAIELQVSVQTDELGIATPVIVASQLEASEALRLIDPVACQFAPLPLADTTLKLVPQQGPSCLLLRLPASGWSYAEMIHSADFQQDSIALGVSDRGERRASIQHYLFPDTLEKGVILRARLRGVFLRASEAATTAAKDYLEFLRSPLPLTA